MWCCVIQPLARRPLCLTLPRQGAGRAGTQSVRPLVEGVYTQSSPEMSASSIAKRRLERHQARGLGELKPLSSIPAHLGDVASHTGLSPSLAKLAGPSGSASPMRRMRRSSESREQTSSPYGGRRRRSSSAETSDPFGAEPGLPTPRAPEAGQGGRVPGRVRCVLLC